MSYDVRMILALANLAACGALFFVCVSRMTLMDAQTTKLSWRLNYTGLMCSSVASGFSPILFHEWPGVSSLFLTVSVLAVLLTSKTWANGVPWYAQRNQLDRRSTT